MHPPDLDGDAPRSAAEREMFAAIRDRLPDPWEAFHGTGFTERDHATGTRDGEIDFVLAHPDVGIFCVEVKGGGVECRDGAWYRTRPDALPQRMKDPFEQAKDQRHALKRSIGAEDGWHGDDLLMGHAVAFPFATAPRIGIGPNAPAEIVVDKSDLADLPAALERIAAYHRGSRDRRRAPGEAGMAMLRKLLAPEVVIATPLAAQIAEEEAALIELTNEQTLLLRGLAANPRVAVTGCAGSGKTMIAVEHAQRLAREGKTVLFVCFNRALCEELRRRVTAKGIAFHTFHGLCTKLARQAGVPLTDHPRDAKPPAEYWSDELPHALLEAAARLDLSYDALFVDEAQDLHAEWLDSLTCLLADPETSPVWLFLDDNQRIYDAGLEVPPGYARWNLSVNCRNTQRIHEWVRGYYAGDTVPAARGPEGRNVELIHTEDAPATVAAVVARLCGEGGVAPQDVVVLSEHGYETSEIPRRAGGRYAFVKERGALGDQVHLASIRAFKGLESPIVVLCELEDMRFPEKQRELLYTGVSRAKSHCVIVAPPEAGAGG